MRTHPATTQTTVEEEPTSRRSETITLAALGTGFGFVLLGLFYGRIQEFSFGGATFKLTENTARAAVDLKSRVDMMETKMGTSIAALTEATSGLNEKMSNLERVTAALAGELAKLVPPKQ